MPDPTPYPSPDGDPVGPHPERPDVGTTDPRAGLAFALWAAQAVLAIPFTFVALFADVLGGGCALGDDECAAVASDFLDGALSAYGNLVLLSVVVMPFAIVRGRRRGKPVWRWPLYAMGAYLVALVALYVLAALV